MLVDFPFPDFLLQNSVRIGPWWFGFYQTPDVPELLIEGIDPLSIFGNR